MKAYSLRSVQNSHTWRLAILVAGVLAALHPTRLRSQPTPPVPPSNIIFRTMQICYSTNGCGAAFTIDVDKKQYLITARHIVDGIRSNDLVSIKALEEWKPIRVIPLTVPTNADVAVLIPPHQLTVSFPLRAGFVECGLGQDVFFLGYPYGLSVPMESFTGAFIKKGVLSSFVPIGQSGEKIIYLDGHNNPGFSGGPIVFRTLNGPNEWRVAGVVSGYLWVSNMLVSATATNSFVQENTGIVTGYSIEAALSAIRDNPIGVPVTQ